MLGNEIGGVTISWFENGRVTNLFGSKLGGWLACHPCKFDLCSRCHPCILVLCNLPPRYDLPRTMSSIPTGNGLSCLLSGGLPVL